MDALQARKNKVMKLSDDLQYKMESIVNEMVRDCMDDLYEEDGDEPLNDSQKLGLFYDFVGNDGFRVPDYMERYFNVVEDHIELKNYCRSYLLDVLGMDLEYVGMIDEFYEDKKDLVNDAIEKFLKINQQLILDSFHVLDNVVILK